MATKKGSHGPAAKKSSKKPTAYVNVGTGKGQKPSKKGSSKKR
jgi:hypothetical protein